ncbi:DUF6657 family protein [Gracilinema caldarium]|uniref:DUF6657 family protein n=1 Tax=Gracilinema caldarium TaxID=215591 RepID=UPI0026F2DC87|nr:DUF6657 family protein [Gracilinema caldarium]
MARIKSALELALERTESVKSDKESIELYELKREGKRLASAFLENPSEKSLEEGLKKYPKDKQEALRQGMFEILVSQIRLPATQDDVTKQEAVGKGIQFLVNDRRFGQLFGQLVQAFQRYLGEVEQFDQAIRRQYAPKLRQKEEELARRLGRAVQIDPFQDPEFVNFYNQNMNALKERYEQAISQVRDQATILFEAAKK